MFIQVIQGTVVDGDALQRSLARWRTEIKPGAHGYQGSTGGVTPDGRAITLVRFDSEASARANSERPEQGAWWSEASKAFADDVEFHNCSEVDTALGGGNDQAGFVQVIQGRAKDEAAMRAAGNELTPQLQQLRPDILGIVIAWHGDGGFTQAVYFKSLEETRAAEAESREGELGERFMSLMDGPPTFFDLTEPDFD